MTFSFDRLTAVLLISCTFFMAAASCKKSSSNSMSGSMADSIGGTLWAANNTVAGYYIVAASQFEIAGAQAKSGDTTSFALSFYAPITVNQAISSDTANVDVQYTDAKNNLLYDGGAVAGHSLLTITSYNTNNFTIGGTFSGVLYNVDNTTDSLVVTGGVFSTTFSLQ